MALFKSLWKGAFEPPLTPHQTEAGREPIALFSLQNKDSSVHAAVLCQEGKVIVLYTLPAPIFVHTNHI